MRSVSVRKLVISALMLALCLVLPLLTGQLQQIGSALLPMHLPVLLCGFVCGWPWGLAVGFIAPLLRSVTFGMPKLFPTAVAMAFELAAYGAFSGLFYRLLPRRNSYIWVSLVLAMLLGRAVWGLVMTVLSLAAAGVSFGPSVFLAGAFINAVPGIVIQLVLVPLIVIALKKARLIQDGR